MKDKFEIKDYLNYSISGLLWMLIIIKFLILLSIFTLDDLIKIAQLQNAEIYLVLVALFGSYLLGNIFRFTEVPLKHISIFFNGDPYLTALRTDRDSFMDKSTKEKRKAFGLCYVLFKKKPLCIGSRASAIIETNLNHLGISNKSKKNQHIMCECYLDMKFSKLNFQRLKNLKNLYESISFPSFVICIWASCYLINNDSVNILIKLVVLAIILFVSCVFIDRYRFLKSNYIKNTYRYFVFLYNIG